ncbi:MAG: hypothetical protein ABI977_10385, partial [Acidobacteriota bacterium]
RQAGDVRQIVNLFFNNALASQADYDSPWKDVLDLFFEDAMAFFFPQAPAQIDWPRGYELTRNCKRSPPMPPLDAA